MKCSRIIYCLVTVTLACLCSSKVKAGCPKQLGKDAPSQPQIPTKGQEPQTCVSAKTCCTSQMESTLRQRAVSELQAKVIKRLDGVKGSTSSLRQDMKGYFQDIVRNAKKESLLSLKQSNANLSRIGGPLVTTFFNQVEDSLENQDINITNIVLQFLRDSFPPLFNYATGQSKRFSNQYGKCLKDKVNNVQLFGSIPYRIATTVESVIKPMQIFLRGFTFAGKVIDSGKQLNFTKGCYPILLQMTFCSMCRGEDSSVKPCEGYCIDVLKNCLMTTVQLQKEWSMFFDAMDNLATGLSRSLIKETLNQVYADLSFAVVQVIPQIQNPKLKSNLFKECGLPSFGSGSTSPSDRTKGKSQRMKASLKEKMETAKTKMTSLRSLFKEMPRDICILDRVSALRTEKVIVANCWNGTAVGRYIGPVSSPLPSLESTPADSFRIKSLVGHISNFIKDIEKHTPDTEGSTSGDGNEITGSGCDEDNEDCTSGSGANSLDGTEEPPTTYGKSTPDDFTFTSESNDDQDGGLSDAAKALGKGTAPVSSVSLVLLLTTLVSFWI